MKQEELFYSLLNGNYFDTIVNFTSPELTPFLYELKKKQGLPFEIITSNEKSGLKNHIIYGSKTLLICENNIQFNEYAKYLKYNDGIMIKSFYSKIISSDLSPYYEGFAEQYGWNIFIKTNKCAS